MGTGKLSGKLHATETGGISTNSIDQLVREPTLPLSSMWWVSIFSGLHIIQVYIYNRSFLAISLCYVKEIFEITLTVDSKDSATQF